jgi:methylglutaconyl-CoA hydratase
MDLIEYSISDRIAVIKINRSEKRNALNPRLVNQLTLCFSKAIADSLVKVIILKSSGDVFSAGADLDYLKQLQHSSFVDNEKDTVALMELFLMIYESPKLVIAQVEGHAIAGGCGLVSVSDIVFSVPEAKFGYTEVKIGFIPALVSCFLIRKLGEARVKELLLSGDLINAGTACNYGLINFILPADEIEAGVLEYASLRVNTASANSVSLTKKLLNAVQNLPLEEGLELAVNFNVQARSSEDCKRGISAFLNKEKLNW